MGLHDTIPDALEAARHKAHGHPQGHNVANTPKPNVPTKVSAAQNRATNKRSRVAKAKRRSAQRSKSSSTIRQHRKSARKPGGGRGGRGPTKAPRIT